MFHFRVSASFKTAVLSGLAAPKSLFSLALMLLGVAANLDAATPRRALSPTTPMWLVHVQHTSSDHPQEVIEAIPADIRPYVVLNLAMSSANNDGYEVADAWLSTCAQYGMFAMMQPSSGINNSMSHTDITPYEKLYQKYPNLIGFNFCEQAWGFDSATFATRLELYADLLELAKNYGGYLYINDNFSLSNSPWNYLSKLKTSARFRETTRIHKEHFIVGNKYTQSYGYYDNESGTFGAYLSGHAGHYAVRFDQFAWGWSGKAQVFGQEYPGRAEFGMNTLFSCPESVAGVPVVEQMLLNGASVIDGPEIPAIANIYKGKRTPMFDNMMADILRKAMDGTIRIPSLQEVAQRTEIAFAPLSSNNPPADLYTGLYEMDGQRAQNRTWFKKTGRYPTIPTFFTNGNDQTALVPNVVTSSDYASRWPTQQAKVDEFDGLFPQEYTGDMFVARVQNKWYSYNPYINTDVASSATVPLKYNTCTELDLTYAAHTFSVITENAESLNVYLNNYRTDKAALWQAFPTGVVMFSPSFDNYLLNSYIPSPVDTPLRDSVLKIRGATTQPTYTLVDRGNHKPSTATSTWADGVFTLTVTHNGPVDVQINCAGGSQGRPTVPAPVAVSPPTPAAPFSVNPFSLVRAAGFEGRAGVTVQFCSEGGFNLTSISNGDWVRMRNVDFGAGASSFLARVAGTPGGSIQLRVDAVDGPVIGTCAVPATAGAQVWKTVACPVDLATARGVKDLYLVFTGGSVASLFNLNWFQFEAPGAPPAAPTDLVAQPGLNGRIQLTWTGGSADGVFTVRRSLNRGGPYETIATGVPVPSFTDETVNLGFTYYYVVSKVASGTESGFSAEAQGSAVRTRAPIADAYVRDGGSANTNFGASNELVVKLDAAGLVRESFLKFDVADLQAVASAQLRLTPITGATDSATAFSYEFVAIDSWTESTVTWTNKPAGSGESLGSRTGYTLLSPVKIDVSARAKLEAAGDGQLSIRAFSTVAGGNKIVGFASREHGESAYRPVLEYLLPGPAAPAEFNGVVGPAGVALSWSPAAGATSYVVKRSSSKGGPYQILAAGLTATTFQDAAVNDGELYYYVVAGVNAENQGLGTPELPVAVGNAKPRVHLRLDEATGTTASDASGNAWDGDLMNGPTWVSGANGRINGALALDGANDHVVLPTGVVNGLGDFTVSCWVKLSSVTTWARIFDFGFGQNGANTMYLTPRATSSTGPVRFGIRIGGVSQLLEGKAALVAGEWQHVAVTLSGTTGTLYVNGVAVATNSAMTHKPSSLGVTTNNYIGRSNSSGDPHLAGTVDEFKIFGRALIASEVSALANPPPPPVITSPAQASGTYNVPFSYAITASNGANSFSVSGLPAGLSLDSATGAITGVPGAAGEFATTLSASNAGGTGSAPLTIFVAKAPVAVTLLGLQQTYDGAPKSVMVTTAPSGLPVAVSYDGENTPPTNAGSYPVTATVVHSNYTGSASDVLSVARATAAIQIGSLARVYDGAPKQVTTSTSPSGLPVLVTYDGGAIAPVYPGSHDVVATVQDGNYSGTASAVMNISISALVRRAPVLNGLLDGSLQLLTGDATAVNSGGVLACDLLVPGSPQVVINGQPTYAGQKTGPGQGTPSGYAVTLNNGAVLRYLVTRIDPIELPIVPPPPAPAGTRSVTISRASDVVGDFATLRNLTLNSGAKVAVAPGNYGHFITNGSATLTLGVVGSPDVVEYGFEALTLNGKLPIRVVGKVRITVAGSVSVGGVVGDSANPDWLIWRFSSGGLTLNSGAAVYGTVVAPNGAVTINGNTTIRGQIAADKLVLNSNGTLEDPAVATGP